MHEQLVERARALREDGLPPKAIARALDVKVADVLGLFNSAALIAGTDEPQCWVNAGWSSHLGLERAPQWRSHDHSAPGSAEHVGGLVAVLVAGYSSRSTKAHVVGFLLDVWCLGVKNSLPPKAMSRRQLAEHRQAYFSSHGSHHQIPAELARELVFGAAAYARSLGFEPDADFDAAASVLGEPIEPSQIRFGRDGSPFYVSGPYDEPRDVLEILTHSAGEGNFDYSVGFPGSSRPGRSRRIHQ